jgi:hypothetical protein
MNGAFEPKVVPSACDKERRQMVGTNPETIRARPCEGSAKALQPSGPKRAAFERRGLGDNHRSESSMERLSRSRRPGMVRGQSC